MAVVFYSCICINYCSTQDFCASLNNSAGAHKSAAVEIGSGANPRPRMNYGGKLVAFLQEFACPP